MDSKDTSDKDLNRNDECVVANWKEGDPYFKAAESLAKLSPGVRRKEEFESDNLEYLAEEISRLHVEDVPWLLLAAYSKMQAERDKLRTELLGSKKPEADGLENYTLPGGGVPEATAQHEVVTNHGTQPPFQYKPRFEKELSRKDLWKVLLSDGFDLCVLHAKPTEFL